MRNFMHKTFRKSFGSLSGMLLILAANPSLSAQDAKPNIILIMADDLGYETIGANGGSSYETPYIDALAETGVRFENCHSQPLCTPSRVQIMTGKYNVRNYTLFGRLDRKEVTFGHLFQEAGYKTAVGGKWQLGKEKDSPRHFGFEESCLWSQSHGRKDDEGHDTRFSNPLLQLNGETVNYTNGEYGPDVVNNFLCDFIERNKDQAFFVYYPMILTHCPFVPTPDSKEWDPSDPGSLSYKGDPKYFGDMVNYMDKLVGKMVSKLDELGIRENTLIIFTGDNGTDKPVVSILNGSEYPGGKSLTTDNGTHVPLVVNWKNRITEGHVSDALIDFSDILPTLCDVADIALPPGLTIDGISFLPALHREKYKERTWIYSWYCPRGKDLREWARNKDYKLYRSGEFYYLENDFFENNPINIDRLRGKEKKAYKKLYGVLENYSGIR